MSEDTREGALSTPQVLQGCRTVSQLEKFSTCDYEGHLVFIKLVLTMVTKE